MPRPLCPNGGGTKRVFRINGFGEDMKMQRQREILIAEDDPHIVLALSAILGDLGHRIVQVVDTAEDAMRVADAHAIDLALIDVWLANGSNGLAAVEHLASRRIPAIVCSAHSKAEEAYAAGAAAFLEKPFRVADLERALAIALAPPKSPKWAAAQHDETLGWG